MINDLVQIKLNSYINENILEDIPWRSGKIDLIIGELSHKGLTYNCLVLSNLNWFVQFKPSFMFIIPSLEKFNKIGHSSNGSIIYAKQAQDLEYNTISKGTCEIATKWFGQPKEGRFLDLLQRLFETGFSFSKFNGFDKDSIIQLNNNSELSITSGDYRHPGFLLGGISTVNEKDNKQLENKKLIEIPARIKRIK